MRAFLHEHRPHTLTGTFGLHYLTKWLLLGLLIGLVAGLGAVAFQKAIQLATDFALGEFVGFLPPQPAGEGQTIVAMPALRWLIPVVTTIGGLVAGLIVFKMAPEAEGHGTDAAIQAYHHREGKIRWRVPYVKLVASAITIGTGGSAGREGPTAQIGGGFGSFLAQVLHLSAHDRRIALAAGMGAGIGAIFKAPLGGGILASEILYLWGLEAEVLVPAFISTIVAYVVFTSFVGFAPVFGSGLDIAYGDSVSLIFYAVLGIACGLGGILYARTFYGVRDLFKKWRMRRWLKPAIGGLLTGLIAMALPQVLGMGYGWAQLAMSPEGFGFGVGLMLLLVLAKIVATSLTVGSGGSGGVFAPGIVIGGLLGATLWQALHSLSVHMPASPAPFVIVGMMAFFGAVGHAPLAVMVMVAEMTGSYQLLAPAMIAVGLATVIVGRNTIYESQVLSAAESPVHEKEYSYPLLSHILVSEAMRTKVITITPDTKVAKAARAMRENSIKALPVVDHMGDLVGIVTNVDVVQVPEEKSITTDVGQIMNRGLVTIHPEDRMDYAMDLMTRNHISHLLVVAVNEPQKLSGIIATSDIAGTYLLRGEDHEKGRSNRRANAHDQGRNSL